ncbi:hypothetical protein COJ03_27170 [Bacillus cereus]|uniref:DUF2971 domain-containing protein n=1 Tax=Bacillus cereus TaxID=1396 RepID=UPI000BF4B444|nr:DUF2971 domain-containing protein [Bacillus cereus]PFK17892.1 hypothetical protein COJ03_27170 [Bacillus cereus]
MSKTLYKYRSLNENTKKILLDNKIWYASIPSLNDPNEGLVKEITSLGAEDFIKKTKENQLSGFITGLSMQKDDPEKRRLLKRLEKLKGFERQYRFMVSFYQQRGKRLSKAEGFLDSIDKMIQNVGILSLSDNPLNTLMWSHYGDNHKGIAIGISDFPDGTYQPINYVPPGETPEINLNGYISVLKMYATYNTLEIGFNDTSLQTALRTKTNDWMYESEWRGVKETYGLYPLEGSISEVIFGLSCNETDREEVRRAIEDGNHNNVSFKEIYRKPNSFELDIRNCKLTTSSKTI